MIPTTIEKFYRVRLLGQNKFLQIEVLHNTQLAVNYKALYKLEGFAQWRDAICPVYYVGGEHIMVVRYDLRQT